MAQDTPRPTLQAGALTGSIRIDGVLDEPDWSAAPLATDLATVEPRQGEAPTGRTLLRVLAGPRALVFGIRCEDPEAARIVSFTKPAAIRHSAEINVTRRSWLCRACLCQHG